MQPHIKPLERQDEVEQKLKGYKVYTFKLKASFEAISKFFKGLRRK